MNQPSVFNRRQALQIAGLGAAVSLSSLPAFSTESRAELAQQAYIWGFPLVQTRLCLQHVRQKGLTLNQIYGAPRLATPVDKDAAGPNVDTIYSIAWLDLKAEPQVVSVPDTHGRYYCMQLIDAYDNSFRYIGRRTTGTGAGHFAFASPDWRGKLPVGVTLLRAPTNTVTIVGRTLVDGPADVRAALAVQSAYSVTPLSAYPEIKRPTQTLENPLSLIPVTHPAQLGVGFFDELSAALIDYPPPVSDRQFVRSLRALGIGPGRTPSMSNDKKLRDILAAAIVDADRRVQDRFHNGATQVDGWRVRYDVTEIASNPLDRAAENAFGLGYNISKEALYFFGTKGPDGQVLDGSKKYVLNFPAGSMPPVDAFWSLTLYGTDWFLQANPINRYSIGDRTPGLKKSNDGSLRIDIQHDAPMEGTANWLPAPAGAFQLVLRNYQPRPALIQGQYKMPPLAFA